MEARGNSLAEALAALGDRWSMLVIQALLGGPKRFGDLQSEIDGIAPNVLSARLRKLADHGLISAQPYSEHPPRFSYELTGAGRELEAPVRLLSGWAARHAGGEPPRHRTCGTALEVTWYCPTCGVAVGDDPDPDEELHYV